MSDEKVSKGKHAANAVSQQTAPSGEPHSGSVIASGPAYTAPSSPKKKRGKVVGIVLAAIVGIVLLVYLAGTFFFMNRFWPNTTAGSTDVSMMTLDEASQVFSEKARNYELTVTGQGLDFTITPENAGLSVDGRATLTSALTDNTPWFWPYEVFRTHDETESLAVSDYTETDFGKAVIEKVNEFNASAVQPTNATVAFSAEKNAFAIVPEVEGTALDNALVMQRVNKAISTFEPKLAITKEELVQPLVVSSDPALQTACDTANTMISANLTLMVDGNEIAKVGPAQVSPWIKLTPGMTIEFDGEAMKAWVTEFADSCNTVGSERTYTRPDGKVITVKGGTYGWQIDNDSLAASLEEGITTGKVAEIEIPVLQTGNGFQTLGGQDWGKRYCDIDLAEQHARFYDETGVLVWESDIVSGRPDGEHDTSTGVYVLNGKSSPSTLIGYNSAGKKEYETKVTYWMPFVGNSIGLHDASWQPSFGGSMYRNGYGSHGCVNLPTQKAKEIYDIIKTGDVVVSHW